MAACVSCDDRALTTYQDELGQTFCKDCPQHTKRYRTKSAANLTACQCEQGVHLCSVPKSPKAMNAEGGYLSSIAGFFNAKSAAGEVRLLERLHALEAGEV